MDDTPTDTLLDLERRGWASLCDGTGGSFYGRLMTDDARMVLADGSVMSRDDVVASLGQAPPWDGYLIEDPEVVRAGTGAAALVYRGTGRREGGDDFVALMTTLYVRDGEGWRLALYTQTPVPA
jgi:hypothetical protein